MLRADLSKLRRELAVDFAIRLEDARQFGGAAKNDDYLQIKEEEVVVVSRILRLEAVLNSATVVDEPVISEPEIVSIGAIVGIQDLNSGALRSHRLVGGFQPLAPGEVSANSPVGRALYGRALGSEVSAELPDGGIRALKIVSLRYPVLTG